jgi:hypothetical protein
MNFMDGFQNTSKKQSKTSILMNFRGSFQNTTPKSILWGFFLKPPLKVMIIKLLVTTIYD